MRVRFVVLLILALAVGSFVACALPVPPTVTMAPRIPIEPGTPLFVTTNRERERVVQSLRDAGLNVSDRLQNDSYSLVVKVGRDRGTSKCGKVANVVYILNAIGQPFMIIKGRGKTGDCTPNAFSDMSQKLASYILQ